MGMMKIWQIIKLQRPVQNKAFTFENIFLSKEANKIIKNTSVLTKFILNGTGESKRIEESLTSVILILWRS